ncbi:MAG: thioredoxin family protein [Crocinitomicaceae bacterium]|nr:thioredoxin family protein [Crocinitomicaceae bacterium]
MTLAKKIIYAFAIITISIQTSLAEGIIFQDLTLKQGLEKAKKENKKVFIDVYATWCGPCKYLSKNIFIDDDLGAFMNEHFISLKIDGEKGDGPELMSDFDLSSYPTMLFLNQEMDLLKKIVGAVGADEIETAGNAVIFPETTSIYKLTQKYDAGDRDREFLSEYVVEVLNNDGDVDPVLAEFLELYPDLNLKEYNEFIVFCIGVTDINHASMETFLNDLSGLSELHGEFVLTKLNMTFLGIVNQAVESNDRSLILSGVEKVYPFYAEFEDPEALVDKDELIRMMQEMYEEEME